jgi:hypothetical protein
MSTQTFYSLLIGKKYTVYVPTAGKMKIFTYFILLELRKIRIHKLGLDSTDMSFYFRLTFKICQICHSSRRHFVIRPVINYQFIRL